MDTIKEKKSNRFKDFVNNKFIPFTGKMGNQTHLATIRDAFALITPLLIAGALAVFVNQILLGDSNVSLSYWIASWTGKYKEVSTTAVNPGEIFYGSNGNVVFFNGFAADSVTALKSIFGVIWEASIMTMTVYVVFVIGYLMAKRRNQDPAIITGVLTLATFIVAGAGFAGWQFSQRFMGAEGLFSGIIIAFLSAEFFLWLSKGDRMAIKMPAGVPPAVGRSFAKLLPCVVTLLLFATISQLLIWTPIKLTVVDDFVKTFQGYSIVRDTDGNVYKYAGELTYDNLILISNNSAEWGIIDKAEYVTLANWDSFTKTVASDGNTITIISHFNGDGSLQKGLTLVTFIFKFFTYPFMNAAKNPHVGLGLALVYVLFVSLFWFFGLHGTNIMNGIFSPVWAYATIMNTEAFNKKEELPYMFSAGFFDAFIFSGGWGMSLALILITVIMGRDKQARQISKASIAPGIFNINEPVTFAYPLMLNPILAIPAILGPCVLVIWTWIWMKIGVIKGAALGIPWVAPVGIGAFLTTGDPLAILISFSNIGIGMAIYLPFIMIANNIAKRNGTASDLEYLGKWHYYLTGKNYQDPKYREIKLRQKEILRGASKEEIPQIKETNKAEWQEYKEALHRKYEEEKRIKKENKVKR